MSYADDVTTEQGQYVQANGLNIYYQEYGSGELLILAHGAPSSSLAWEALIPFLSSHFRVIVPDARGQGRTKNPSPEIRLNVLADDVIAFIQALKLETPFLFGWSTGGDTAINIAIRYPGSLKAMVTGGVFLHRTQKISDFLSAQGFEGPGQVNLEQFKKAEPDFVEASRTVHPQGPDYWKSLITQLSYDVMERVEPDPADLAKIKIPTLIIWGDRDGYYPVEDAVELYGLMPNAELAIIPNADHGVCGANVEVVTNFVKAFLLRHTATDKLGNEGAG